VGSVVVRVIGVGWVIETEVSEVEGIGVGWESGLSLSGGVFEFSEYEGLVIGDVLFTDPQLGGDIHVSESGDEQQFGALQAFELSVFDPVLDELSEGIAEQVGFRFSSFTAAYQARGNSLRSGRFESGRAGIGRLQRQCGSSSLSSEHVGQFVSGDGEQEAFESCSVGVVVG